MCWCGIWWFPCFQRLSHTDTHTQECTYEKKSNLRLGKGVGLVMETWEHTYSLIYGYSCTFLNTHTHTYKCEQDTESCTQTTHQGQQKDDSQQEASHCLLQSASIQNAPLCMCVCLGVYVCSQGCTGTAPLSGTTPQHQGLWNTTHRGRRFRKRTIKQQQQNTRASSLCEAAVTATVYASLWLQTVVRRYACAVVVPLDY